MIKRAVVKAAVFEAVVAAVFEAVVAAVVEAVVAMVDVRLRPNQNNDPLISKTKCFSNTTRRTERE